MLRYVTKAQYWEILDQGLMSGIRGIGDKWRLKDVQDAVAYSHLHMQRDRDIAEIGAGHPRLLEKLGATNRCHAIDEYKGDGNGPRSRPRLDNVTFISCTIGSSAQLIPASSYDTVFSVSVVEHVPEAQLDAFFEDCRRILRPGGLMVHLIDVYSEGPGGNNNALWRRVQRYLATFREGMFAAAGPIEFSSIADVAFKTCFISNPDNIMHEWNRSFPGGLVEKRKIAQSCTIEMAARRAA